MNSTNAKAVDQCLVIMESLSIKNLGLVRKFLGMRTKNDEGIGYKVDEEEAINDCLRDYGLINASSNNG